jgi:hypothetical protein
VLYPIREDVLCTLKDLTGYVKLKILFRENTELLGPYLWLATGDTEAWIFDLVAPFLSPPLQPLPPLF